MRIDLQPEGFARMMSVEIESANERRLRMLEYHAAYYSIEDGWFMARVLDFPGVISQGKSIEHARKMIKDALCLMVEHKLEQGTTLPTPKPRARDKKADFVESIKLKIRAKIGVP